MADQLSESTALVTGASGGLGEVIARELAPRVSRLWLHAHDAPAEQEKLDALKAEIGAQCEVETVLADLSAPEGAKAIAGAVKERGDAVNVLVNNAGINIENFMIRVSPEEWSKVLDVNLSGPFHLTRLLLPAMAKKRWGRVVFISSIAAVADPLGQASYASSKAGLFGLSRAVASEMAGRNITSNVVVPGLIDAGMTDELSDERREALISRIPMKRFGTPGEIAATVLFLVSPQAGYITGQTLHVNGGGIMH